MKNKINLTIVLGTAREDRESLKVANFIYSLAQKRPEFSVTFFDIKEAFLGRTVPPWEENKETSVWRALVKNSSAFIIVSPEYNHSFPGELKMLLDQELEAYNNKMVLLAGVSGGKFGGARVIESLLPVLNTLGLKNINPSLYFSEVEKLFKKREEQLLSLYENKINKGFDKIIENI
ncbi:MAG: NAD(P)H-dependent oxidoreductase [Candidatus Pacebacteria bacterium]|nr:NAD(P)H-dependent oxidoreductase [Candidatus Paceibacterota bacterium]